MFLRFNLISSFLQEWESEPSYEAHNFSDNIFTINFSERNNINDVARDVNFKKQLFHSQFKHNLSLSRVRNLQHGNWSLSQLP